MNTKHTKRLLAGLPLTGMDAARLVLEAMEEMPELAQHATRGKGELMRALRRVLREGICSVREQAEEHEAGQAAEAAGSVAEKARGLVLCPPLRAMRRRQRPARRRELVKLSSPALRWVPGVLRHTSASYHARTPRNLPSLQLQLGHREAELLLTRYLRMSPLRRGMLRLFWRMLGVKLK